MKIYRIKNKESNLYWLGNGRGSRYNKDGKIYKKLAHLKNAIILLVETKVDRRKPEIYLKYLKNWLEKHEIIEYNLDSGKNIDGEIIL